MFAICQKKKIVYFRTRKIASSTIIEVLTRYDIIKRVPVEKIDPLNKIKNFYDHTPPCLVEEVIPLQDFIKITSIRDPLSMIKSWFFYNKRHSPLGEDFQNIFLNWLRESDYSNIKFNDSLFEYNDYNYIIRFEHLKDDLKQLLNNYNIYDYTILNEILDSESGHYESFKKDTPKYPIYFEKKDIDFISEYFKKNKYLKIYYEK